MRSGKMSEKRFIIFPNNVVWDNQLGEVVCRCILEGIGDAENVCQRLNEQEATIEEYEDFCLNLCKFLIGKGLVDEYREEYGKEYKIITKWKGCGSDD